MSGWIDSERIDGLAHRVSLYLLDWQNNGTLAETIDVLDAATGQLLTSASASGFQNGRYLSFNVTGNVRFHINRASSLVPRLVLRNRIRPDSQFGTFAKKIQDLYTSGKTTAHRRAVLR